MSDVITIERKNQVEVIPAVIPATGANTPAKAGKQRVAAYCRVSTEQEEQLGSFQNQVTTYEEKINSNPEWIFAGIYADEGISGTRAESREGFQKMMDDCRAGKIDRIITKSISRFSRNAEDSLKYTRELKNLGISVYFEEERIDSLNPASEMLYTILASVAEQESRNISEHTRWGVRAKFKKGDYLTPKMLSKTYGYKEKDGKTVIDEEEAETVRLTYKYFLDGFLTNEIARNFETMGIHCRKNGGHWSAGRIQAMLENEKYTGDVTLQKTYVPDFMKHRTVKNNGEREKFEVKDHHQAIVDRDTWNAAQLELKRREELNKTNGGRAFKSGSNPYSGMVFYKTGCKVALKKFNYGGSRAGTWKCSFYRPDCPCSDPTRAVPHEPEEDRGDVVTTFDPNSEPVEKLKKKNKGTPCTGFTINDKTIKKMFRLAFNSLVTDGLEDNRKRWEGIVKSKETNALQKYRAKQMLQLTAPGTDARLSEEVPEITKMVLMKIELIDPQTGIVYFLDGTVKQVQLARAEW